MICRNPRVGCPSSIRRLHSSICGLADFGPCSCGSCRASGTRIRPIGSPRWISPATAVADNSPWNATAPCDGRARVRRIACWRRLAMPWLTTGCGAAGQGGRTASTRLGRILPMARPAPPLRTRNCRAARASPPLPRSPQRPPPSDCKPSPPTCSAITRTCASGSGLPRAAHPPRSSRRHHPTVSGPLWRQIGRIGYPVVRDATGRLVAVDGLGEVAPAERAEATSAGDRRSTIIRNGIQEV